MKSRCSHRGRVLRAGGAAALLVGTPFIGSGSAQAAGSFEGTASAFGFDYLMKNRSIAAGVEPQFSGPVAQASLTSLPSGTSFASFPYPGEVAAGVPGLVPSVVQGLPQTPSYPFLITSGLGQGRQEINQPGIGLRAQTEETDASAHAVLGTEGSGSVSDAWVRTTSDRVIATASARQNGVSLGPQGEIATVISEATVVRNSDGTLNRTSNLAVSGIRIPGLEFTVPDKTPAPAPVPNTPEFPTFPQPFAGQKFNAPTFGFYNGQFTMAFPFGGNQQYAVPNDAVEKAFAQAGYDVVFTKPIETRTGIIGGTFSLHFVMAAPPDNPLYTGPTDVTLVLGRALATVGGDADQDMVSGHGAIPPGASGVSPAVVAEVPTTDATSGVIDPGTGLEVPVGTESGAPLVPGTTGTDAVPTVNMRPAQSDRVRIVAAQPTDIDVLSNFYWVIVAAGAVAFFSIPTLRVLGVRSR